jgi:hypothetical protein
MNREARRHQPKNGIQLLPHLVAQAQQPQGPVFNVGPLMNGDQLVAFVAAHLEGTPTEVVDEAMEIVAQAIARSAMGELDRRVKAIMTAAASPAIS